MTYRRPLTALVALGLLAGACSRAPLPTDVAAGDATTDSITLGTVAGLDPTTGSTAALPEPGQGSVVDTSGATVTAPASTTGTGPAPAGTGGGTTTPTTPAATNIPNPLYTGADDVRGITDDRITFCAHAALTYGAAFNTSAEDLNVYWTAVNDAGGIFGRRVEVFYENDNYSPDTAIEAAKACKDKHDPFALLGGIGFDQIPAVRSWAENNRMLYVHHTATVNGEEGKQFSFSPLASTEKMGEMFAELAASRFTGRPVGIVKRQSPNWEPGIDGFKRVAAERGVRITKEREVAVNKGSYLQDVVELRNSGADVVFVWLNALETVEFIGQAWAQGWQPQFMIFPFNIVTQTLGRETLDPPLVGINMHNAYSAHDTGGPFAAYADDIRQFETQYDTYRPDADYEGVGGDLMFLNWVSQKATHAFLVACGPDCTRSKFAQLLKQSVGTATPSVCPVDFTRPGSNNGHRGGYLVSVLEAYQAPSGRFNFRNVATCVEHL